MSRNYIDFISAYCDRWCERCAFTERCSSFAVESAMAMCDGDLAAALELAVGPAAVPEGERPKTVGERMADTAEDYEPSEKELDEIGREMEERRHRISRHPLATESMDYAVGTRRWLESAEGRMARTLPPLAAALDVITWDSHLIHVKIMRALDGRDEHQSGASSEGSAMQSDWDGSAKVALLSSERSEAAWRAIAAATGQEPAIVLAGTLRRLIQQVDETFPAARRFKRPGFDD
jgi:hypothetical protein